jgi:Ca-activated chloride channel family protein
MRLIILLFLVVLQPIAFGQVTFDKLKHDFGDLESYDERFVDFILTNKGQKKEYVLSVKKPYEVNYIVNGKFMDQDSSVVLRFQINPKVKGRFSYDIDVFVSDRAEAVKIKITGNLKDVASDDLSAFTACPDFSSRPGGKKANNFQLTVITIDSETKAELSNSKVSFIQNGIPVWTNQTDKNGKIKEEANLGFSYFYASHEAYKPAELGAYVNFQRNVIVLELAKDPSYCPPPPATTPPIQPIIIDPTPPVVEIVIEEELLNEETTAFIEEAPVEFSSLAPDDFSAENFNPINVVFVLDVSSSMQQGDRIELMKYSLFQLMEMLRPMDKIGIVTFSSDSRVVLAPTNCGNKETIQKEIENLKASGLTAGGEGIKLGYQQALKGFVPGGTNQIIVITDGAFNRNSDDYKKYVKKYKKKGINMSVVGIKIKDVDQVKMTEAAEVGGGRLVPIMKLADAQANLKQEIRFAAFKR